MNKKDYKRYKQIKLELEQLEQDKEDTLERIQELYDERNIKVDGVNGVFITLKNLLRDIGLRKTIMSELLLPKRIKIEDGYQDCIDFWVDNDLPHNDDDICEYISMYLTDSYNHNLYGFDWVVKGTNIYVNNIRWNKGQILVADLKHYAKKDVLENDLVRVVRDVELGSYLITDKETKYTTRKWTLRETIEWLESHYYM